MMSTAMSVIHLGSAVPFTVPQRDFSNAIKAPLQLVFAVGWSGIYLMAIRRGFIEKVLAIPLIALAGDFAWEFMFSFVFHVDPANRAINLAWFAIDCVIVSQAVLYGRRDYQNVSVSRYRYSTAGLVGFAFAVMFSFPHDLGGVFLYAALLLDCFLSYMFISMLHRRGSTAGQTMYIAAVKIVANACATAVAIANYPHRLLFDVLFVTTTLPAVVYY